MAAHNLINCNSLYPCYSLCIAPSPLIEQKMFIIRKLLSVPPEWDINYISISFKLYLYSYSAPHRQTCFFSNPQQIQLAHLLALSDLLMNPGAQWKTKCFFYFILTPKRRSFLALCEKFTHCSCDDLKQPVANFRHCQKFRSPVWPMLTEPVWSAGVQHDMMKSPGVVWTITNKSTRSGKPEVVWTETWYDT